MSEFAMYKGKEIKIGTCECMYYLRWEQRHMVRPIRGNVNPVTEVEELWFRAPRYSENDIAPGAYPFEGWCGVQPIRFYIDDNKLKKEVGEIAQKTKGIKQLIDRDMGIVVGVPCAHGYIIDDLPKEMHYNGFNSNVLGVAGVGVRKGHACALIGCLACGDTFLRMSFEELVRYCKPFDDKDWRLVLETMMRIEADILLEQEKKIRKQLKLSIYKK